MIRRVPGSAVMRATVAESAVTSPVTATMGGPPSVTDLPPMAPLPRARRTAEGDGYGLLAPSGQ